LTLMIALLTHRDRQVHRLQREIARTEAWLREDAADRRAAAFHQARLAEMRAELHELVEES
jgi:hypothetical protein